MSNFAKMYWLTRLDSIQGIFIALTILSVAGIIIYLIIRSVESYDSDDRKEYDKENGWVIKTAIPILIVSALGLVFIPSKDDMIFIYAGGKTLDFVQSDSSINKIPGKTTKIVVDYIDKQIKDLDKK